MLDIRDHEALPGRAVEWRVHADTVAAADRSGPDSRPPSHIQEAHLRAALVLRELHVDIPAWLAVTFEIAGRLDRAALETAFLRLIDRHETLRSGFRVCGERLERFTLDAGAICIEAADGPLLGSAAEVTAHLEERFGKATDPLAWPYYTFVVIEREKSATVYLAFDHINIDAYSLALATYDVVELYEAAAAGRGPELPPVGSYVDFCHRERESAGTVGDDHETVAGWRGFLNACGGRLPSFPLDLGVLHGEELPRQSSLCEWLLDAADADAFGTACRKSGGTFLSGVLAAAGIVAREVGRQPVYRSVIPFHTRSEAQWVASMGWYIGVAPITVDLSGAQEFHEAVRSAEDAVRAAKPMADVPFFRVSEFLGPALSITSPDPFAFISYIDMRVAPGADSWEAWKACVIGRASYGDQACMWINRGHDGVYVACRFPDTRLGRENVPRFVRHLRRVLTATARTGAYRIAPEEAAAGGCGGE
ncbi:condensation domain-containing protein [Streptomyces meridianus]|uniref:Condensation domain-containing protein n=1 Tax=Streptomyces meridianus TaxID=2938945 RepID=A0ABT0X349_9ACTN|nr:condensation domain-containing protein [Streptomyces meridianus]MCM2576970.1 condensation domain-containing protein [Streptomyces meridianus]